MIFYGKWDCTLDDKWRLRIPAGMRQIDKVVFLEENDNGCVQIRKPRKIQEISNPTSTYLVSVKVQRGRKNRGVKRILIPQPLRESISFYFGPKVTLVGKGDYLEIWPRP